MSVQPDRIPPYLRTLQAKVGTNLPSGKTFGQHFQVAVDTIDLHNRGYADFLLRVWSLATPNASVVGRVKHVESALAKLLAKPHYKDVKGLTDVTGVRITTPNLRDVAENVRRIKRNFKVVEEDNYIKNPKGYYRAYHLLVRDQDGLTKEIQIETENESKFNLWQHNIYKPVTKQQKQAVSQSATPVKEYAQKLSDYFHTLDRGGTSQKPVCPTSVHRVFGCL